MTIAAQTKQLVIVLQFPGHITDAEIKRMARFALNARDLKLRAPLKDMRVLNNERVIYRKNKNN